MVFFPRAPIDLLPLPSLDKVNLDAKERAELILKMHEITKENIESMTEMYKIAGSEGRKKISFQPGDLVWLHLRKDRFPKLRKSKLMPRADGPFHILEKINDNAYKLDVPTDFGASPTFNVSDLKPYMGDEGEDDDDIVSTNKTTLPTAVPPPEARPTFEKVYTRRVCNVIVIRNKGKVEQGAPFQREMHMS